MTVQLKGNPRVIVPAAGIYTSPHKPRKLETEVLFGEEVIPLGDVGVDSWLRVRATRDGYEGFMCSLVFVPGSPPSHRVLVLDANVYAEADFKSEKLWCLPLNALVEVVMEKGGYSLISDAGGKTRGWVLTHQLGFKDNYTNDPAGIAEQFIGRPYTWGGCTAAGGIDCSGLVQQSFLACGIFVPRDTGPQSEQIGTTISSGDRNLSLQRCDLVFWPTHVGIMVDQETLLHATLYRERVVKERLADVISFRQKQENCGERITVIQRP